MNISTKLLRVLSGKQLLIFDFDGTLADTSDLHAEAFSQVLDPFVGCIDYNSIAGLNTEDAIRICFQGAELAVSTELIRELTLEKQSLVRRLIDRCLQPLPGTDEFLGWAKSRFQLALATSGSRGTVCLALQKLGYLEFFDPMVFSDDVTRCKPDPECFLRVLSSSGVPPSRALIFEDSAAGIKAAKRARIQYFCVDQDGLAKHLGDIF